MPPCGASSERWHTPGVSIVGFVVSSPAGPVWICDEAGYFRSPGKDPRLIFKQFYLSCLAHASYLIGDEATGTAAVVDPQRDVDQYLAFASEHGLAIKHVFLTHLHADFVAGHLELRDRAGAAIYLGARAKASGPKGSAIPEPYRCSVKVVAGTRNHLDLLLRADSTSP